MLQDKRPVWWIVPAYRAMVQIQPETNSASNNGGTPSSDRAKDQNTPQLNAERSELTLETNCSQKSQGFSICICLETSHS